MNTSIILAQIMGLYFTIASLAMIIRAESVLARFEKFTEDSPFILLGAIIGLLMGILLIVFHNVWVWNWPVLITILGWLIFIRGIVHLIYPEIIPKLLVYVKNLKTFYIINVVNLIIGLFLLYKGFF